MTEAPQVDVKEQPVTGKGADDQKIENSMSFVATLLTLIGDKLAKKTKFVITYFAAKKVGIKVVFLKGNRKVYDNQLETLWKSAKDKKMFEDTCHVVPLRPILEKFKDIEAYDLEGNQVTLDSPDVDFCLAVYDGQHRITVCELHPGDIDVELELNDFNGTNPIESIKLMNSHSRNWSTADLRTSNVDAGLTTNKLYEESEKLTTLYGISYKTADYILTFEREATKKKDLVEGNDTTEYNEDNGNRGTSIFNAIMMKFNGAKEAKRIELIDAVVHTYTARTDNEKPAFARNMKIFMGTLPEMERDKAKELIKMKNYGQLKVAIKAGYEKFCKAGHSEEELIKMEAEIDKAIATYRAEQQKTVQAKGAKKALKTGYVNEVIKHDLSVAVNIENDRLKKAKEKLVKAQKIAQEAQAVVCKLEANNAEEPEWADAEEIK